MEQDIQLIHGDCLIEMKKMPDKSIDLTVTSPPYDNLRNYGGAIDGWSFEKFQGIAKELYRITKDGGVVVWVVGDATIKGSESGTSFRQALYFMECGFNLHDTMIWKKTNPMPRVKTKRYFDCFEYMFVFSKGVPNTFNPIMQSCKSAGKIYNSTCKNIGGENGRTKKTFVLNNERFKDNIWEIAIAQNKTSHPAVFPEKLAQDHIISWSNDGDTILDCFMGSGTTGKMALLNNRKFIGIEKVDEYFEIAKNRVEKALEEKNKPNLFNLS